VFAANNIPRQLLCTTRIGLLEAVDESQSH